MFRKLTHWLTSGLQKMNSGIQKIDNGLGLLNQRLEELNESASLSLERAKIRSVEGQIRIYHQAKSYRSRDENLEALIDIVNAYDELSSPNKDFERQIIEINEEINANH